MATDKPARRAVVQKAKPIGLRLTDEQLEQLRAIQADWGAATLTEATRRLIVEEYRRLKRRNES